MSSLSRGKALPQTTTPAGKGRSACQPDQSVIINSFNQSAFFNEIIVTLGLGSGLDLGPRCDKDGAIVNE